MEQKDELEAGSLVIKNIVVIEQAIKLLDEVWERIWLKVEPQIACILKERIESWEWDISENKKKIVDSAWFVKDDSWLDEDKKPIAKFAIFEENKVSNDYSEITKLCGLGESTLGFSWSLAHKALGLNKNQWKKKAAVLNEQAPYTKLKELGFQYDNDGNWFLPMHLDAEQLAEAWLNNQFEDFLDDIVVKRMNVIFEATPIFDAMLKEVQPGSS